MKKIYITSSLDYTKEELGIKVAKKINNKNRIINQLKKDILKFDNLLIIASSKNSYKTNDFYNKIVKDSFNLSSLPFKSIETFDGRSKDLDLKIKNADLIILSGGDALEEIRYFEEIELKEKLLKYNGVLLGISAGSMNLAKNVYCAPEIESEVGRPYEWEGLGLIDLTIEPHFEEEPINLYFREILLKGSEKFDIIGLPDTSHITYDGQEYKIFGDYYTIKNKEIKKEK